MAHCEREYAGHERGYSIKIADQQVKKKADDDTDEDERMAAGGACPIKAAERMGFQARRALVVRGRLGTQPRADRILIEVAST